MLAGRYLCLALLKRRGSYVPFRTGSALAFLGGTLFLATGALHEMAAAPLLAASAVFCVGFGTLLPIGMKAGLSAFPERVGASSALYGCLTLGATAAGSGAIGSLLTRSAQDVSTLAVFTFACGALVLLASRFCKRALADTP